MTGMLNMVKYTETVEVLLGEAGKYLLLLLFSVLAIRLWRRQSKLAAADKQANVLLAGSFTAVAAVIGFLSINHSLSRLYYHFGVKAFDAGNLPSAASLFNTSSGYWQNANAVGGTGICLLLAGNPDQGRQLLEKAKGLRGGQNSYFEEFYEGTYYFFQEQPDRAVPLLEAASASITYQWDVAKLLSVVALEKKRTDDARRLMQPFAQIDIAPGDCAHAYVMASLKLADGKPAEAGALLDKIPAASLSPFWKKRFAALQSKLKT